MKIYSYWVDQTNSGMPEYIKLCMHTWALAIPDIDLEIINHDNVAEYLPERLLTPAFYKLSLAMQSDVVSVWVLRTRGGIFIDADTLITSNPFAHSEFQGDKLTAFGYPEKKSIHLAILCCPRPNNPVLIAWANEICTRLSSGLPAQVPWNYVGNGIVDPLLQHPEYEEDFHIIDAKTSGNILECASERETPTLRYLDFYFMEPKFALEEILEKVRYGFISLHNSWTPDVYRKASLELIVQSQNSVSLSHLLMALIDHLTQAKE